ncbi:interleukin-10 receptor subunit beta-like [Rana temporaria]|uniref:interleukin-10 receptor subunit beta-like n=1 Tax=Rana temporaria TaxID=8407 RepID=UPI001AADCBF9|nr:interleukin-10 receptor subunit beta-like [Rana temporaria]
MYPYTILVFLCLAIPGFGKLPNPTNVRMDSVKFKNILRWNPPPGITEDVVYRVQYKLDVINEQMKYTDVCMTNDLKCDLTYIKYKFYARVSAAVGDKKSDWMMIHFDPSDRSFGKLPEPTNVRMDSVNFKTILKWNPPPGFTEDEDVLYIVQYKLDVMSKQLNYANVCITKDLKCDLSDIKYKFDVRLSAAVGDNKSEWMMIHFDPYNETVIGPPEVLVSSRSGHLDISMSGPFLESDSQNDTIKDAYGELFYRILYWKKEDPSHVLDVSTPQSEKTLTKLETWTNYCLKVQAYMPESEREGQFSPTVCEKTTSNGRIPWWQIAGVFLITMLLTMTTVLGLCYFGFTAYTRWRSFPSYSIPEHMKEFLSNPFNNTPTLPSQSSEEYGESCEPLTFLSEENEETKEETNETA